MNSLQPSGMERMFVSAQPYWESEGVSVRVLGQGRVHPYANALRAANVDVVTTQRIGTLRGALEFRRELHAWKPDVVHIHSERSYWIASVISATLGFQLQVRTIHNTFNPRRLKRIYRRLVARTTDHRVGAIVACSQDVATNERNFGRTCRVVLNWVDDRFFEVQPSVGKAEKPRILIVGNCSPIKRHWLVLEAAISLGIEVVHFGNESGADEIERSLLAELENRGQLVARGVHDPASAMSHLPTFVLPSTQEGMPVSLCEAIAADLPAVVSDAPGLQWAKEHGGIRFIKEGESWTSALADVAPEPTGRTPAAKDSLRAHRGAAEYALVYQAVTQR